MLKKFKRGRIWYVRGTVRGIRVYETTGTPDTTRAEEYRARREAQLWDRSVGGERGTHTFGEATLIYLEERRPGPHFRCVTIPPLVAHFGRWQLDHITQTAVDRYIAKYHAGSAPGTRVRGVITPLTAILRTAAKRKWCDLPAFERPRVDPFPARCLNREEAARLVEASAPPLQPLIVFLLHTGARLGEALQLQWREVNLKRRHVAFLQTKNGESRSVPLNDDAFVALSNLPHRKGCVFLTPAGAPYYDSRGLGGSPIKRAFKGACKRAGLFGLRVHDLRHTFASWLVMSGTPLRTVAELLGHKSLAMVHRYSHLSPEHLRAAVDQLCAESVQFKSKLQQPTERKG